MAIKENNEFYKTAKKSLKTHLSLGIILITISFLDVIFNSFFHFNFVSFFPM